jgi:hypothetical protein
MPNPHRFRKARRPNEAGVPMVRIMGIPVGKIPIHPAICRAQNERSHLSLDKWKRDFTTVGGMFCLA